MVSYTGLTHGFRESGIIASILVKSGLQAHYLLTLSDCHCHALRRVHSPHDSHSSVPMTSTALASVPNILSQPRICLPMPWPCHLTGRSGCLPSIVKRAGTSSLTMLWPSLSNTFGRMCSLENVVVSGCVAVYQVFGYKKKKSMREVRVFATQSDCLIQAIKGTWYCYCHFWTTEKNIVALKSFQSTSSLNFFHSFHPTVTIFSEIAADLANGS